MYRRLLIILLMYLTITAQSQIAILDSLVVPPPNITAQTVCYWFDNDSSVFHYLPLGDGNIEIPANHLDYGYHTLHTQLIDSTGQHYPIRSTPFQRAKVTQMAQIVYWFDQNYADRHYLPVGNDYMEIDASRLSDGFHVVNIQLINSDGSPYTIFSDRFNIPTNHEVARVVFWFDDQKTTQYETELADGHYQLHAEDLNDGYHMLYSQVIDERGNRFNIAYDFFKKEEQGLDSVIYWVDDTLNAHRTVEYADHLLLDFDSLTCGAHTLYMQGVGHNQFVPLNVISTPFQWIDSSCCPPPLYVSVDKIGTDTACIHWSYNRKETFLLALSTSPFDPDSLNSYITVTDTQYTFTGLSECTQYYYALRTGCDSFQTWTNGTFNTIVRNHPILYVSTDGDNSYRGGSWEEAFADLGQALYWADSIKSHYGTAPNIWVAEGRYTGDGISGHNAFTMVEGCSVYGGLSGTETADFDLSTRNLVNHPTVLDGQQIQRVIYQPIAFETMTRWDGFEIRNGANGEGAGAYLKGNVTMTHCQFLNDSTPYYRGGAIYAVSTSAERPIYITNCIVTNCTSSEGTVYTENAIVENCLIYDNHANQVGGIYAQGTTLVANTNIVKNKSNTANLATGIYANSIALATVNNSIVWGNTASTEATQLGGNIVVNYSGIEGGYTGQNNNMIVLASENQADDSNANYVAFASPIDNDFHLTIGSACIDAGRDNLLMNTTDLEGNIRPWGLSCDMGPYELHYFIICPEPTHLTTQLHTDYSVTLSWIGNNATQYIVSYRGHQDSNWTTYQQTDTSLTLSGLERDLYDWNVMSICESGDTSSLVLGSQFDTWFHPEFDTVTLDDNWNFADITPADNGMACTNNTRFEWHNLTNATTYDLYIWQANTEEPTIPVITDLTNPSADSVALPNYQPGNHYMWKIVAKNRHTTRTSPTFMFETPLMPSLTVSQILDQSARIDFENTAGHIVSIAIDTVPIQLGISSFDITSWDSTYLLNGLDMNKTYYCLAKVDCGDTHLMTNMVHFTTKEIGFDTTEIELCQGEHYRFGNTDYYQSGVYSYRVRIDDTKDSLYVLKLTIHPTYNNMQVVHLYEGETYTFNGREVSVLDLTTDTMQTIWGCDSIQAIHVYRKNVIVNQEYGEVCQGNAFAGSHFTITGTQTQDIDSTIIFADTVRSIGGFDSVIYKLNLTVTPPNLNNITGLMPTMDSVITDGAVVLRWNRVENATKYRLYLWKQGMNIPTTHTTEITNNYYTISNYENHTAYAYIVAALNGCDTIYSPINNFEINKAPLLTTSVRTVDFGEVEYDDVATKNISVSGEFLNDTIRMTIVGDDADMFSVSALNFNAMTGGRMKVSFHPSAVQHDYTATLRLLSDTTVCEVALSGQMSNYYLITLNIEDSIYSSSDSIPIVGTLKNIAGVPQTGVDMDVYVQVLGQTKLLNARTDAEGNFAVTYKPILSESGYYQVGACLHNAGKRDVLDEFNIPGISFVNATTTWDVYMGDSVEGYITIRNRCNLNLNNIIVTPLVLPNGLSVEFDTISLAGLQTGHLHYRIVGSQISVGNDWEDARFALKCDLGHLSNKTVYYYCQKPVPDLRISYDSIICTTMRNSQKNIDLVLYNNTDSVFHGVQVTIPTGADYINLMEDIPAFNIAPHESAFVHLLVQFGADAPLGLHSGEIRITADNTMSQYVPYAITVASDAQARLNVTVVNEYTYANGTNVAGARVQIVGYYSKDTVADVVTDSTGVVEIDSIMEGYYDITVSAPQNSTVTKLVHLVDGVTTYEIVDIEYQAVVSKFIAYQEDIEDNYTIRQEHVVQHNVPKPVVYIETANDIDFPYDGSPTTIDLVVTNDGLIDAYDVEITVPNSDVYEFIPLYDRIDTLKALTSRVIPCSIRNKAITNLIQTLRTTPNVEVDTLYEERTKVQVTTVDTMIYVPRDSTNGSGNTGADSTAGDNGTGGNVGGMVYKYYPIWKIDTQIVRIDTAVVFYDTLLRDTLYWMSYKVVPYLMSCEEFPFSVSARYKCNGSGKWVFDKFVVQSKTCKKKSQPPIIYPPVTPDTIIIYPHDFPPVIDPPTTKPNPPKPISDDDPWNWKLPRFDGFNLPIKIPWECEPCWFSITRNTLECATSIGQRIYENKMNAFEKTVNTTFSDNISEDILRTLDQLDYNPQLCNMYLNEMGQTLNAMEQYYFELSYCVGLYSKMNNTTTNINRFVDIMFDSIENVGATDENTQTIDLVNEAIALGSLIPGTPGVIIGCIGNGVDAVRTCTQGFDAEIPPLGVRLDSVTHKTILEQNIRLAAEYYDTIKDIRRRIVGWTLVGHPEYQYIEDSVADYMIGADSVDYRNVVSYYEPIINIVDTIAIHESVNRWNRMLNYMRMGITRPEYVPEGISRDFFYLDTSTLYFLINTNLTAIKQGFNNVHEMALDVFDTLYSMAGKQSLCAETTLQLSQDLAMTREAFKGVLSITNTNDTAAISDLSLSFTVTDSTGRDCSDRFDIRIIERNYPDSSSIAPGITGVTTVQFVPLITAASQDSVKYNFGGSIRYNDPRTGAPMEDYLTPVSLIVTPSPQLKLDYFVQKDILADDPLTPVKIEKTIPATIGLLVNNVGYGRAKNVRMSGLTPDIKRNDLGLVVKYSMLNSLKDGWEQNLPLQDIYLGNIEPKHINVIEYQFVSTLLGSVSIGTIDVIHNSSIDDKDLALVTARTHSLIKPILEYGQHSDAIHDFLVNDVSDTYNYPDSIYFSSGRTTSVTLANNSSFDHYVTPNDTTVVVSMMPQHVGWNYTEMEDPGRGNYDIVSCVREDSVDIPLDNIWLTFVDLYQASDPVYVNKLHLVDTMPAGHNYHYNVTFRLKEELLCVDSIENIPTELTTHPVEQYVVRFNKPIIDSTFSVSDMSLKCNNGHELINEGVAITRINDSTYSVNVSGRTLRSGLYVLDIYTDSIMDTQGYYGVRGSRAMWNQLIHDTVTESVIICEGEDYSYHGQVYSQEGNYNISYFDSVSGRMVFVTLTVETTPMNQVTFHSNNGVNDTVVQEICHQGVLMPNSFINHHATFMGWSLTENGMIHYNNNASIDLNEDVDLYAIWSARPYMKDTTDLVVCDSVVWHDRLITTSGIYLDTILGALDEYDSIHLLNVNVSSSNHLSISQQACDSFAWNGETYLDDTTFVSFVGTNTNGCDSIITLVLTLNNSTNGIEDLVVCDSVNWHGTIYNSSTNSPTFTTTNSVGCDSTTTLNLTVHYSSEPSEYEYIACDSLSWNTRSFYTTTDTQFVFTNSVGCDSAVSLHITINYASYTVFSDTAEDSYYWNGATYTISGIYEYHTVSESGCDSTTTLILLINGTDGINSIDDEGITVYPNPTLGLLNIVGENISKIQIYDASGRVIISSDNTNQIDLSDITTGIYFVRITHQNGVSVKRVMKR